MQLLRNRIVRAYLVIAVGALLFFVRRALFQTYFEGEGLPFDIAVPSNLNSCYLTPGLLLCSDAIIVGLTIIGVVIAAGWGSLGLSIFAAILAIPPLLLYFALSPIVPPLLATAFIPLALEIGTRILVPRPAA